MNMAKFSVLLFCAALAGCAGSPAPVSPDQAAGKTPEALAGIDWMLLEIQASGTVTGIDRSALAAEDRGEIYSLRFDDRDNGEPRLSGMASPNRYSAPCSWTGSSGLSIGLIVSTKMMDLRDPPAIGEHEYFGFLTHSSQWTLSAEGRLELSTTTEDGGSALMVFVRK
jgi:heat shock protein HslJ